MSRPPFRRSLLVGALVVALVVAGAVGGTVAWKRLHRTPLQQALALVPAGSLRVGFTDWAVVRRALKVHLGSDPSDATIQAFTGKAYDSDLSAASSIDDAAAAMQDHYGFGPANAQWEAYAQSRQGATMVLKVADGTDFGELAGNLARAGYAKPAKDDGVWKGGVDLVANLDPTLSPEVQYVVLLKARGLVVTSDSSSYAARAAAVASGGGDSLSSSGKVEGLADTLGRAANAMVWSGDFACEDLAMSKADADTQKQADALVAQDGGVTPLSGLAMSMSGTRTLRVVEHFEDGGEARRNLRPRAKLAVGDALGRGDSFSADFTLVRSSTDGASVLLDLKPRQRTGFVLSALYDGPLIFATC